MRKIVLPLVVFLCSVIVTNGQIKNVDDVKKSLETTNKDTIAWTHGGVFDLGANEGFLHNWAAGGELASLSVNGLFSGYLNRLHHWDIWSNNLDLAYGLTYAYSTSFIPHKTDDRIDFTSKYGIRADTSNFYFTGLFNFKSQFTKGYNYTLSHFDSASTSKFLSPAYFTTAIGIEYRRGSNISFFLSPIAARLTLADKYYTTMTDQGAFGVPYNKTSVFQFGAYFSGRYLVNIGKKAVFKTRLDLYSNYLAKNTKNDTTGVIIKRDNPGNISVLFDNLLSYKISKFFNITVGATFIYDNNIPYITTPQNKDQPGNNLGWLQLNQTFSLGIEYKFH